MFNWGSGKSGASKRKGHSTDRRAGPKQGPYVGKQPRSRTLSGTWRKKRADARKKREPRKGGSFGF